MSIATVVLGGYGNGTVAGSIALVVTDGYALATVADPVRGGKFVVGQVYHPGIKQAEVYHPGFKAGQVNN